MRDSYNLIDFIKMYYPDSNIPMYLFVGEKCTFCMPEQGELTHPPMKYIENLLYSKKRISYCTTKYGIIFCALRVDYPENGQLVFGPITNIPYTESDLQKLYKDYTVPNSDREDFNSFLHQIPCLSLNSLLKKCLFLNYCLHEEVMTLEELTKSEPESFLQISLTDASLLEETYQTKENEQHNQTYAIEEQILKLVRTGNYKGFNNIEFSDSNYHLGVTGSTALRQLRNDIIITTTICTRAAIEGGLDYDSAYQLSDYFIQSSERLSSIERLYDLLSKVGYSFAEKVANSKTPVSTDGCIQKAIRYIQQNTNQHLTVGDVASYVGFSKSYFSAYFKKTLGFSVSAFILRCKLEEGKELLQYTNKSISTISTSLCFSSQSHFHTAFKKQYGITPSEYRRLQN
ncbi:helix-turn-helix domain-containing protein [Blautia obeum]|uniref:helix-turn-helix domain-containing protein n=1 Tax=Blautia obeum TaxID=40520 RepID=UPI00156FA1BF|nr:helix-turn-helix domain-containing protein [Blautia obeum]NSJ35826.1 helix-turn-helix domain-containing protein [Blautia obeum]